MSMISTDKKWTFLSECIRYLSPEKISVSFFSHFTLMNGSLVSHSNVTMVSFSLAVWSSRCWVKLMVALAACGETRCEKNDPGKATM